MDLPDNFSDRLRLLREKANLKQKELADRVGMTPQSLNDFEKGRRHKPPAVDVVERLARELNVSPSHLIFGPSKKPDYTETPYSRERSSSPVEERARARYGREGEPVVCSNFNSPPDEPTEEQCLRYFADYLKRARRVPGGIGHTWIQLQLNFPKNQFPEPTKEQDE